MKTNKQKQTDNRRCVEEINAVFKSVRLLYQYKISGVPSLSEKDSEKVIKETCKKYKTKIDHIKTIIYGKATKTKDSATRSN